jgi:hypothetical protein
MGLIIYQHLCVLVGGRFLCPRIYQFSKYRHCLKPIAKTGSWAQPANGGTVTDPRVKVHYKCKKNRDTFYVRSSSFW